MTDLILPDPGGQISEPGAYRLSMARYHDPHLCVGPSVSSSGLRTIELQSPWDFWAFSGLNPEAYEKPVSDAFDFGRAAHALLLGDEDFDAGYVVSPYDSFRTKEAREWRDSEARTVITAEQYEAIKCMADRLHAHGLPDVIFGGEPEVSLIWRDVTGVWVKARPDALPEGGELGDLKTTTEGSVRKLLRSIDQYGYDMQMALCAEGMERVLGRTPPGVVLIFAMKKAPYTVTPISLSEDALYWARMRNRRALDTFAACLESGHWPSEGEQIVEFDVPDWRRAQYEEQQADGRLPNEEIAA